MKKFNMLLNIPQGLGMKSKIHRIPSRNSQSRENDIRYTSRIYFHDGISPFCKWLCYKEFFFFFLMYHRPTVLFFTIRKSRNGIMATEYHCTDCTFTEDLFVSRRSNSCLHKSLPRVYCWMTFKMEPLLMRVFSAQPPFFSSLSLF